MIGYKKYLEMGIRIKRFMFVCICLLWGMIITAHCQSVLVEAELFKNKGGWSVDTQFIDQMGSPYLLAHGLGEAVKDAVTEAFTMFGYGQKIGHPIRKDLVNSG